MKLEKKKSNVSLISQLNSTNGISASYKVHRLVENYLIKLIWDHQLTFWEKKLKEKMYT